MIRAHVHLLIPFRGDSSLVGKIDECVVQLDLLLVCETSMASKRLSNLPYESNIKMKTAIIASLVAGAAAFAPAANKVSVKERT
jgi:hypothetical protein